MGIKERIANIQLRERMASPEEAAMAIRNGMNVAMSGITSCGYPKVIPIELVKRKESGEDLQINLITGSNLSPKIDDSFGTAQLVKRRVPLNDGRILSKFINRGEVHYVEQQINKMPDLIQKNTYGKIDIAVIEALAFTKEGYIIPTSSVGMTPHFVNMAETIIVELNLSQPMEMEGLHDIYLPSLPPNRKPIPLTSVNHRIGEPFIRLNPDKIKYIVESNIPDSSLKLKDNKQQTERITDNLLNFLELEVNSRMNGKLLPIQTGFGNLANDIVTAFNNSGFNNIEFFSGFLQEANIDLIVNGKAKAASTSAVQMTPIVIENLKKDPDFLKKALVVRNIDITNNAEAISRLGVIALNSAIEIDIYGNVNSSHVMGNTVVNGIGGGANFAQNSGLSILLIPSQTKGGNISTIVPMVSHCDIGEHDIDIIITENGVADLRGKDDIERASCIIQNCTSSIYKDQLNSYLKKAINIAGGHHPQLLSEAFSWHLRFKESGTMKI